MWGRPTYSETLVPRMCWNWVNTTRDFWWREPVVGGSDGSTGKGGADVTAHPLGQPRQSTRPLSTTTTTAAAAAVVVLVVVLVTWRRHCTSVVVVSWDWVMSVGLSLLSAAVCSLLFTATAKLRDSTSSNG